MADSIFPVDARTYFQTLFGNREPITERDFSANELANIQSAIEANQRRTGASTRGNVGYADYPKGEQIGPGYDPIENTLGRFNYRRLPSGEIMATDRYDFLNDERKASVEDYERMGALQRATTVLGRGVGRTFYDPRTATGLTFSPRSIFNELGDAYIGREGRDVRIKLPPVKKAEGGAVTASRSAAMAEENRPFIGYRSAGRRPESQQDRRASADAPLAALRGMVSGVLGAPGDIESLVRMLPGLSEQTVLPTSEDVEKRLPMRSVSQTPVGQAFTTAGQLGGGFYTGPGSPLRAVAALPSAVSRAGRDFALAGSPVHVVKPKGGNWMSGSVGRVVNPMQQTVLNETGLQNLAERAGVDVSESVRARQLPEAAMNRWLETKLGKYIKNEMATPEDPVRALAERGVLHVDPEQLNFRPELHGRFMSEGQTAVAQSPAAKSWEGASDLTVGQMPAGQLLQQGYAEQMPWLAKVPPETPVYMPSQSGMADDLGFGHLVDELRNAVNPASGLPENLRWKYSDLDKVTVPQAVERVAKINDWRAAQKAEADMARAMNPATQVVKEYPEQGYKWVELRQPKETGKKVSVERPEMDLPPGFDERQARDAAMDMAFDEGLDEGTQAFDDFVRNMMTDFNRKKTVDIDESYKALEDALKYEGETMGHCVGGYCPDVVEGRSKIYSLRDKKGQPHVTIEVAPRNITAEEAIKMAISEGLPEKGMETFNRVAEIMGSGDFMRQDIVQIKGKGNKAPKEDYLPAVQDFVRSGNWSSVGDLGNTGLMSIDKVPEKRLYEAAGMKLPKYVTEKERDDLINEYNRLTVGPTDANFMSEAYGFPPPEGFSHGGQVRGYAEGGMVGDANFPTDDFDPARIDTIVGELHALNAG